MDRLTGLVAGSPFFSHRAARWLRGKERRRAVVPLRREFLIIEEHRLQFLAHLPLHVVGKHTYRYDERVRGGQFQRFGIESWLELRVLRNRVIESARLTLLPHLIAIGLSVLTQSWLPVLLFGLHRFYGSFIIWTFIVLQHAGLEENIWDHRRVCRSFRFGPLASFFLLNMQNHIEHHLYPLVPFYALPSLNRRIANQLPEPYRGLGKPLLELFGIFSRQRRDSQACIVRPMPESVVKDQGT
ncbi:MAG: fatty acid desaturase [Rectinemataceae bacterium]